MARNAPRKDTFEDAAHKLYSFLVLSFLVFIDVANLLAYIFSARYRSMISFGKFVRYILMWTGLTLAFWWMMRQIDRDQRPFRRPRKTPKQKP